MSVNITANDILASLKANCNFELGQVEPKNAKMCAVAMAQEANGNGLNLSGLVSASHSTANLLSVATTKPQAGITRS